MKTITLEIDNTPETEAQRERREYFTPLRGAIWTSKGIENTEAELKCVKNGTAFFDRNKHLKYVNPCRL